MTSLTPWVTMPSFQHQFSGSFLWATLWTMTILPVILKSAYWSPWLISLWPLTWSLKIVLKDLSGVLDNNLPAQRRGLVQSLVWEDSTATEPAGPCTHTHWAVAQNPPAAGCPRPVCCSSQTWAPRACLPQQEKTAAMRSNESQHSHK